MYKKPPVLGLCLIIVLNNVAMIDSSYRLTSDSSIDSSSTHVSSEHSLDSSTSLSSLPAMSTFKYRTNHSKSLSSSLISADASEKSQVVNTFKQQWWNDINNADQAAYTATKSKNTERADEFRALAQKRRHQFESIETLVAGLANGNAKNQQWLTEALDYCDTQARTETNHRIGLMFKKLAQKWKSELIKYNDNGL